MTALNPVAALRHDLRTPVNHIVGYAEMLLEDLEAPVHAERRAALEQAIAAARDALRSISVVLAPSRETVQPPELAQLYATLEEPQRRIVESVQGLLELTGEAPTPTFAQDLKRILDAAARLRPADAPVPAAAPTASAADDGGSAPRILVVDDEEGNRELLRRRLEREGYAIVTAGGGQEALATVARERLDLVLLDMMMPDLPGDEVLGRLKDDPATRDLPVIMISALDEMPSIARCIERGAEDYLPKPFDPVLLRARIKAGLEKKRWRDQERAYLRAVDSVIEAATAVERGTYSSEALAPIASRGDALGRLARVFDGMVARVRAREAQLKDQVRELRAEIETARRDTHEMPIPVDGGNLETGETFANRYRILGTIGRGGMGTVYRARDTELDEEVAIKTLIPSLVRDETAVSRFKDEIRLARRLTDRHIVRTHDMGEWNGIYYLTMELVEGLTLRTLLDTRGRLAVPAVLAVASQLARSLEVAHEHGVIHRDIKPQNLLLDAAGVLKVMDFGVARLAERSHAITEVGMVVGTPAYMAPEQLMGETVDGRCDLYSAGVVLYECLAGRLPFEGATIMSLVAKQLAEQPEPLASVNPAVPAGLADLVMRLLEKRPEERLPSAEEFSREVAKLAD
jgi:CheY-like chemotaxis protein